MKAAGPSRTRRYLSAVLWQSTNNSRRICKLNLIKKRSWRRWR